MHEGRSPLFAYQKAKKSAKEGIMKSDRKELRGV